MASPQNGSQYPSRSTEELGNPLIDTLTGPTRWGEVRGAPITLSYSFPWANSATATWATNSSYSSLGEQTLGFALGPNLQAAVRLALASWGNVANISFTEVADTPASVGDLRFANTTKDNGGAFAWAYYPSGFGAAGGDVWVAQTSQGASADAADTWRVGSFGYLALVHEIGHALGLAHPGDNPTDPAYTVQTTVMSYNDWPGPLYYGRYGPGGDGTSYRYAFINPQGPSIYDIAAIQSLYGANTAYRAGADTYQFSPTTPFFQTLWDGGGIDEISVANFTAACVIDLNPGSFSSIGVSSEPFPPFTSGTAPTYLGQNNLGIAFGCLIENATGGSGGDTLRGNAAANLLRGGAGNDVLSGGGGADTFVFAASGDGADTVLDFDASDRLLIQGLLAATAVQAGNGTGITGRTVQLLTGEATSILSIDTNNLAGADLQISLSGRWTTQDLRVLVNGDGSSAILRNAAPVVSTAAASRVVNAQSAFSLALGAGVVSDPDQADTLSLSLQRVGGQALPAWLSFDAATRTLSGQPAPGDVGLLRLRLSAQDAAGASASQDFTLVVVPAGFEPLSYTASHADLRAAFGTDAVAAATHYLQAGIVEGRAISFDPLRYIASNPDLVAYFGLNTGAATAHYITNGANEGRQFSFDALRYIASNPDLIVYFGLNTGAATAHYITNGANEGRQFTFDALRYIASNPDLIAYFGLNTAAATTHYIANGYSEGRQIDFDAARYLASNPDLAAAFGSNTVAATQHYIANGYSEGRSAIFAEPAPGDGLPASAIEAAPAALMAQQAAGPANFSVETSAQTIDLSLVQHDKYAPESPWRLAGFEPAQPFGPERPVPMIGLSDLVDLNGMGLPGPAKGSYQSAQHEAAPVSAFDLVKGWGVTHAESATGADDDSPPALTDSGHQVMSLPWTGFPGLVFDSRTAVLAG